MYLMHFELKKGFKKMKKMPLKIQVCFRVSASFYLQCG